MRTMSSERLSNLSESHSKSMASQNESLEEALLFSSCSAAFDIGNTVKRAVPLCINIDCAPTMCHTVLGAEDVQWVRELQ